MSYREFNNNPSERLGIYVRDNIYSTSANYTIYTHDLSRGAFFPLYMYFHVYTANYGAGSAQSKISVGTNPTTYTNYYASNGTGGSSTPNKIYTLSILDSTPVTASGQTIVAQTIEQNNNTFTGSLIIIGIHAER